MSRIEQSFVSLRDRNRKGLIPFITAGDPNPQSTVTLMHGLVEGGADLIELGVPFSDPMADGPAIQRSSERALAHHTSLEMILDMVREFRSINHDTPIIMMGYLNPIEIMGYEEFCARAAAVGVDGVLIVDLPPEEADSLNRRIRAHRLDQVFLLSPTTAGERIKHVCDIASGFIYYIALQGVTGSDRLDVSSVESKIKKIREHTSLPIGAGFGIKDRESAARVGGISDAVVIGSALVEKIAVHAGRGTDPVPDVQAFIASLRVALDENN